MPIPILQTRRNNEIISAETGEHRELGNAFCTQNIAMIERLSMIESHHGDIACEHVPARAAVQAIS